LKRKKILILIISAIVFCFFIFTIWINLSVTILGNKYSYDSIENIPHNHCALVLGTSKYLVGGRTNMYYLYRIQAATYLYFYQKVDYIIVSGDNRARNYNEPIKMYNDLVEAGIPKEKIILDYAGFRTLDSVIRGKEIFGQSQFTIVSQPFHSQRAVYIARKRGINAIAYNAEDVVNTFSLDLMVREIGARVLMGIDLLLKRQPHFLGEKVVIPN